MERAEQLGAVVGAVVDNVEPDVIHVHQVEELVAHRAMGVGQRLGELLHGEACDVAFPVRAVLGNEVVAEVKPLFLAGMYADMRVMEREIATQPLSWTVVRPPQLLDGLWTGVYRTAKNGTVPNDGDLTRGDLAHFILDELEEEQYLNAKVDIAY